MKRSEIEMALNSYMEGSCEAEENTPGEVMTMDEKQLMDFDVLTPVEGEVSDADLQILFVLNGSASVQVTGTTLVLEEKDFLILNPFQAYAVKMDKSTLVMRFRANVRILSDYYDISKLEFLGNSVEEASERHTVLRNLLEKCITYYYGKKSDNGRILLKLNSLYYEIAELLISSFSIVRSQTAEELEGAEDESLIQEMTRYIRMNYQSALKLEDLADHFFLSPPYISRFFKKKLGINFAKYLTDVRLEEATKKLEQTDNSLTWIAMDCGFPNLTAFNKAFREKYQMSPKQYRAELKQTEQTQEHTDKENRALAEFQLLDYFEKNNHIPGREFDEVEQVQADASEYSILEKNWNKMINIGGIYLLLQKEIQDHTLFLCKTLGYEYVRIWDLYEQRMHINAGNKERRYNFSRLDTCLDFLSQNHIKPYLELGFKPFILLRNYEDYIFNEEREIVFDEAEEYGAFIRSLMKHLINRYSSQELSAWYFELWCDPRWFPEGEPATYIEYFEEAYQAIKELMPRAHVGGAWDRSYGIISFEHFIEIWSTRNVQPDFLSIYCYAPLLREIMYNEQGLHALESERRERMRMHHITDGETVEPEQIRNFQISSYVESRKRIMLQYGMMMPLLCSEWNFTVINSNVVNDSRFKGAYVMKEIMNMYQELGMMGYWFGTDQFAEDDDAPMLLNGRCGLITHQGICKPAYWAILMMNRLEDYLLKKTEHTMVTRNEFGSYVIACHNYKPLDIQYYVQKEMDVRIESIPHFYENETQLTLNITITGVKNGKYHIKTRVVNSQYGGVQDEWLRMGKVAFLTQADVEYIDHMSRPHITISEQIVTDQVLRFSTKLEAQEIQLIHAFRYMEE